MKNNKNYFNYKTELWDAMSTMKLIEISSIDILYRQLIRLHKSIDRLLALKGSSSNIEIQINSNLFVKYLHKAEKLLINGGVQSIETLTYTPVDIAELYLDIESFVRLGETGFIENIDSILYEFYLHPFEHLQDINKRLRLY